MKKKTMPSLLAVVLVVLYLLFGGGGDVQPNGGDISTTLVQTQVQAESLIPDDSPKEAQAIDEFGSYTTKEDVALYIHTYGRLPDNFVTKDEAEDAGWHGGGLEDYLPGMCIGGDRFGNREGLLPSAKGRSWTECDINTLGKDSRGAERIVFSNDGLIYYTPDHYDSFQLLYE